MKASLWPITRKIEELNIESRQGAEKTVFTPKELGAYRGFIGGVNGSDVKFVLVENPLSAVWRI